MKETYLTGKFESREAWDGLKEVRVLINASGTPVLAKPRMEIVRPFLSGLSLEEKCPEDIRRFLRRTGGTPAWNDLGSLKERAEIEGLTAQLETVMTETAREREGIMNPNENDFKAVARPVMYLKRLTALFES